MNLVSMIFPRHMVPWGIFSENALFFSFRAPADRVRISYVSVRVRNFLKVFIYFLVGVVNPGG